LKKSNNDLVVGAIIFISLFILLAGVLWLKEVSITSKQVKYTVLFPQVGELAPGNAVKINGVKCGQVYRIYLHEPSKKVAVEIKVNRNNTFTDSSILSIKNIGIMGERMINITLSEKGKMCIPDTKDKINYINGYFDYGIAETMGMLGNILDDVQLLVDTIGIIVHQTVGNPEFVLFFNTVIKRIDSVVILVDNLIKDNQDEIKTSIHSIQTVSTELKNLIAENRGNVNGIISDGKGLTEKAVNITDRLDSMTVTMNSVINYISMGKGSIGMMIKDESTVTDLKKTMYDLDMLVKEIRNDALKLRIKIFGNRKYFNNKVQN